MLDADDNGGGKMQQLSYKVELEEWKKESEYYFRFSDGFRLKP